MRQRDLTHRYIPAGSILRPAGALAAIAVETFLFQRWIPVNITTVGFLYLITILAIATEWGLVEAVLASVAATVCYNFFFFPPVGTLTIADPLNWVALLTFLITSLTASQLSERAKRRTREAASRQLEMESLYSLSRAILLAETDQPLARHVEVLDIGRRLLPRHLEHARGHIDPHHRAPPPHVVGQSPGDQARPASHVQGVLAWRRMRQRDQPLGRLPMEAVGPFVVMGREVVEEGDELRQEVRGGVRAQVRGVC